MFQSYNFYYQRGSHSDRTITEAQHWKGGLVVMKRTQLERRPALFLAPFLKKSAEDETKTKTDGGKRPRAENCWRRTNIRYQMDTQVGSRYVILFACLDGPFSPSRKVRQSEENHTRSLRRRSEIASCSYQFQCMFAFIAPIYRWESAAQPTSFSAMSLHYITRTDPLSFKLEGKLIVGLG